MQGQIAYHLGRRCDLDGPPEELVAGRVEPLHLLEAVPQAQGPGLGPQVRELPAGDLVAVDGAGRRLKTSLEGGVHPAHRLPVGLEVPDGVEAEAGGPLGVVGHGHHRGDRRLGGHPGQGRSGRVHRVHPGLDGGHIGGELAPAGVVGVQMHGLVEALPQRGHQRRGCAGSQQSGHVLDAQDVHAGLDQLLRYPQVVVEGVQVLGRVGQVARVADRPLGDGPGLEHGADGRPHLVDGVEGVEDSEDVHPGLGRLGHEMARYRVRVGRVADRVAAAQQHLGADVGRRLADAGQPLPRILVQEPQGHVEGGPSPALHAQQLRHGVGHLAGTGHKVDGAKPGGEDRLVGVPQRRVGHLHRSGRPQLGREPLGPKLQQALARPGRRRARPRHRQLGRRTDPGGCRSVGEVNGHVGQVAQQPGGPVGPHRRRGQLGAVVDEAGGDRTVPELVVGQDGLQVGLVGGHPPHPVLGQRALHSAHHGGEVLAPAGDLLDHGVEVGGYLHALVDAAVEADPGAAGRPVGHDPAGVGTEVVGGVLSGHPALQGEAPQADRVLGESQLRQRGPGGDQQLRFDQVDVGDLLGHRVLHLDPWVHLDEDVAAGAVHEELHRAGVGVSDGGREADCIGQQAVAHGGVQIPRRRHLDHLLEAALDRAVALVEVDDVARRVGQHLGLDVADAGHGLLQEDGGVPEGAAGLPLGRLDRLDQTGGALDPAHPPAAPAGGGLHEQREADAGRMGLGLGGIVDRRGLAQHRQPGILGGLPGSHLVAGQPEHRRAGPDEGHPGLGAGLGEVGTLGQEAVAGVHGVRADLHRLGHDGLMVEVGPDGTAGLADHVGLVGLDAMERTAALLLDGEDGDGPDAQLGRGPEGSDGYLTAVGDQELLHAVEITSGLTVDSRG